MLKHRSTVAFVLSIIQQCIGIVTLWFISHYMGPGPLGLIGSAVSYVTVFMSFTDLGFGLAHTSLVSSDKENLASYLGVYLRIKFTLVSVSGLVCLSSILISDYNGARLVIPREYKTILYVMLLFNVLSGYLQIAIKTFEARLEKTKEMFIGLVMKLVVGTLRICVATAGLGAIYLSFSSVVGVLIALALAIYFLRTYEIPKFDLSLFRRYVFLAMPGMLIAVVAKADQEIDRFMLSYLTTPDVVGFYTGAKSIVQLTTFVSVIFVGLILPKYFRLSSENLVNEIGVYAIRMERYITFPIVALASFMFCRAEALQDLLLGDKFLGVANTIRILILATLVRIISMPFSLQLVGTRRFKHASIISVVLIFGNISLGLFLIPDSFLGIKAFDYKAEGAAYALLLTSVVGSLGFRIYAYKISGATFSIEIPLIIVIGGGVNYLFLNTLEIGVDASLFLRLLIEFFSSSFLFFLTLRIAGIFRKDDFKFYMEAFNINKILTYIRKELSE